MKPITIKDLDIKRFNALAGHTRSPAAAYVSQELAWYSNEEETVLGVLLLDTIDNDYVAVVLGRDEGRRFRAIDVSSSMQTIEEATEWLIRSIKWQTSLCNKTFPQGDDKQGIDLFSPVVPIEKQHPFFVRLTSDSVFLSAKSIINEMMPHFIDIDGNFVEQFQSDGFDSRLWELYIYSYLTEEQLFINREYEAPDFIVEKYGKKIAIEAVIVGRQKSKPPKYFKELSEHKQQSEILKELENSMPIKFGSPLYSKLNKKYWELKHVSGNPLVFAIADFHDDQSMLWSSTAIINYLYGYKHDFYYDENNQLIITPVMINSHKVGNKEIPSGYFFQPNSEHVSAILIFNSWGRKGA